MSEAPHRRPGPHVQHSSHSPHSEVRARFLTVGRDVIGPSTAARERAESFDADAFRRAWSVVADAGLFALPTLGARCAALEGLAHGSLDLGLAVSACAHFVVVAVLERDGTAEQRAHFLPGLTGGTRVGACANAEAAAGTDLMGLKSRAWFVDDDNAEARAPITLSARKRSVTNLGAADVVLVSARAQGVPAREAINVFVVDAHGPRLRQRFRHDLMGLRTSPTGSLLAWRAPLPAHSLVGARGDGVRLFRRMFSEERITTGFLYLGSLKYCRDRAVLHAEGRSQFGQPIGKNQYVQEKLVRMQVAIELLEAFLWRCVDGRNTSTSTNADDGADNDNNNNDEQGRLSVIKVYGIEAALQAAQDLVRLLGSRGVSRDEPAERLVRDLLALSILGGTAELHKMIVYGALPKPT